MPPETSLDALLKLLSAPAFSYLLIFIVQRRKILLSVLQAIFKAVSKQEADKHASQEMPAVNGNGHKEEILMMNLEGVNARLRDLEGDYETIGQRIDRERKERLQQELAIRAEFDKVIARNETYRKYTDEKFADAVRYTDTKIVELQTDLRRDLDDIKTMLRDMAA